MIQFPPFELDTVNQCLWRRGPGGVEDRILLPLKALAVLSYLAERPGRLVTEDELLRAVWPKLYVQPEVIKSQMYTIRKILGDDPKSPRFIETLPRRGYQFIAPVRAGPTDDPLAAAQPVHGHLVGRDGAIAELWNRLRRASGSRQQIVFVTGEPGIGKTAVVDEFQRQASIEMPGLRVARGQCIEAYGATEAYYPILEALGQLCQGSAAASVVRILAAQAPTWLVQFPALLTQRHRELLRQEILGATRERMVRELGVALEAIAADTPLLLVIEDLQWVDHSTVDLISALARRPAHTKLMLIATKRPVDFIPAGHALEAAKDELRAKQLCHVIELKPLAEGEVSAYLAAAAPQGTPPAGLAELVHRHTEGNPFFMVAALAHLIQRGLIARVDEGWQLTVPLEAIDIGVPEDLRQMIEAQIGRLSTEEQRALEVASVQGAVFSTSICSAVINRDTETYENLYDSMAQRGHIVRPAGIHGLPDGSISSQDEFVHALYREVLYRRQAPLRRAKVHQRIGERLEALYSQQLGDLAPQLAHHFEKGADWQRAARYLLLVADTAARRYARREAMALLQRALELSGKLPEAQRVGSEMLLLEKQATMWAVSTDTLLQAVESYEFMATRASQHGLVELEVRALIGMAYPLYWFDSRRCVEVAERALRVSAEQPDLLLRARARANCHYWRVWTGGWNSRDFKELGSALAELRQIVGADRTVFSFDLLGYALHQLVSSQYRDAQRNAAEGLAIVLEAGDQNPYFNVAYQRASLAIPYISLFLGEWGEALRAIKASVALMNKNADEWRAQTIRVFDAWVRLQAMDFEAARAICKSALQLFKDHSHHYVRTYLTIAGQAEANLGNYERAFEYLSTARNAILNEVVINTWVVRNEAERALTDFWLMKGDLGEARPQAKQFLEYALTTPEHTYQALAWEANARIAIAEGDLKRAQDCIAKALGTMEGYEVPLASWRVHATATELCRRAGNEHAARKHQELSRMTIRKLADSLPAEEEALRETFLSAPPVARILATAVRT